jgi:hypothetical protein
MGIAPMTEITVFTFHTDAGHGWLQVSIADLSNIGMSPRDFSRYSYQDARGLVFYLEEDCDASKFITAWEIAFERKAQFRDEYQHNSFVRRLNKIH